MEKSHSCMAPGAWFRDLVGGTSPGKTAILVPLVVVAGLAAGSARAEGLLDLFSKKVHKQTQVHKPAHKARVMSLYGSKGVVINEALAAPDPTVILTCEQKVEQDVIATGQSQASAVAQAISECVAPTSGGSSSGSSSAGGPGSGGSGSPSGSPKHGSHIAISGSIAVSGTITIPGGDTSSVNGQSNVDGITHVDLTTAPMHSSGLAVVGGNSTATSTGLGSGGATGGGLADSLSQTAGSNAGASSSGGNGSGFGAGSGVGSGFGISSGSN